MPFGLVFEYRNVAPSVGTKPAFAARVVLLLDREHEIGARERVAGLAAREILAGRRDAEQGRNVEDVLAQRVARRVRIRARRERARAGVEVRSRVVTARQVVGAGE